MNRLSSSASLFCTAAALLAAVEPAHAGLMLTQAGIDLGFSLTTFVSGYSAQYGPLAQGIAPNGRVITGSLLNTRIYAFNDVDGQTLASAVSSVPYTCETGNCNFSMTTAGGQAYGAQASGGVYYRFAGDGSFTPIPNLQAAGLRGSFGMWGNPVDGHLSPQAIGDWSISIPWPAPSVSSMPACSPTACRYPRTALWRIWQSAQACSPTALLPEPFSTVSLSAEARTARESSAVGY